MKCPDCDHTLVPDGSALICRNPYCPGLSRGSTSSLATVEERPRRAEVRPSCRQVAGADDGEPSSILHPPSSELANGPVVIVRMIGSQEVPAACKDSIPGVVWSESLQRFELPQFNVVGGNSSLTLHGTYSEDTLKKSGARIEYEVAAGDLSEPDFPKFSMDFAMAMHAAWDMAEEGNIHMTITALEAALHLAKVQGRDAQANEAGVPA